MKCNVINSPRQVCPSVCNWNPGWHSQRKLPWLLMQIPFSQGFLKHSFTSDISRDMEEEFFKTI